MSSYRHTPLQEDYRKAIEEVWPELSPQARIDLKFMADELGRKLTLYRPGNSHGVGPEGALELIVALIGKGWL